MKPNDRTLTDFNENRGLQVKRGKTGKNAVFIAIEVLLIINCMK